MTGVHGHDPDAAEPHAGLAVEPPNPARMYDYALGGSANFQADRDAAEEVLTRDPEDRMHARANRAFLRSGGARADGPGHLAVHRPRLRGAHRRARARDRAARRPAGRAGDDLVGSPHWGGWNRVPTRLFGASGATCWRRLAEWQQAGVWQTPPEAA